MKMVYGLYVKDADDGIYRLHRVYKTMIGAEKEMKKHQTDAVIYELPLYD